MRPAADDKPDGQRQGRSQQRGLPGTTQKIGLHGGERLRPQEQEQPRGKGTGRAQQNGPRRHILGDAGPGAPPGRGQVDDLLHSGIDGFGGQNQRDDRQQRGHSPRDREK